MSDGNSNSTDSVEMIGGVSLDQVVVVTTMNISFSSVSLVATTIGSLMFLYIRLKYPRLSDRVTFRLAFATMVSDLFYAIFQLLLNTQASPTPLCTFILWGFVFFSLLTIFFPTCIAINLQATFVNEHEYSGRRNLEKFYFLGSIVLSILLSFLPFVDQMYSWDYPEGICWFRDSGTRPNIVWQWSILYVWEVACVLYIIIILVVVVLKLRRISDQLIDSSNVSGRTMTSQYDRNILKNKAIASAVVRRIMWYPIVPLITQTVNFLVETDVYINKRVSYALLLVSTLNTLQGLLNTFAFLQDIAVNRTYRLTKLGWWVNYVNKYEKSYPQSSRNKSFNPSISPVVNNEVVKDENERKNKQQPSFGEKLRYILLTLLFNPPKDSDTFIDYDPYYNGGKDEETSTTIHGKTETSAIRDETEYENSQNKLKMY